MAPGIGAGGIVGIALESTPGTYVAPQKFIPVQNESLKWEQETNWRRPIRQVAGVVGAVAGRGHVEGSIESEAFEDIIPYFMYCSRMSVVKTGTTNFTYTGTPTAAAIPTKTMSVTVVRNGVTFGYVGVIVGSFTLTVDNDMLMYNVDLFGTNEASQSAPTATWPTTVPFGHGQYNVQIPTTVQVFDTDGFEFTVDDSAEVQYRLKSSPGSQFTSYGERSVELSTERDFEDRTEYDAFKALTSESVTILASKGANNQVQINVPAAIKDTYELGLSGQGDLLRASVKWNGVTDALGKDYELVVKCQEDITL
jgi:hypothetical protein